MHLYTPIIQYSSITKMSVLFLHRFTHYQYQLVVYNDVGFSAGEVISAVTMAGIPHQPPSLSAYAINHTAVRVNWTQPCKTILSLITYTLQTEMTVDGHKPYIVVKLMAAHWLFSLSAFFQLCKSYRERWNPTF